MKKSLLSVSKLVKSSSIFEDNLPIEKFDMSQIQSDSQAILSKWQSFDLFVCLMSVLGLFSSIIDYEIYFSPDRTHHTCTHKTNNLYRFTTLIFTIAATFSMIFRYFTQLKFYNIQSKHHYKQHYKHLFKKKSRLNISLLLEIAFLWVFPYPSLEGSIYLIQSSLPTNKSGKGQIYSVCYSYSEIFLIFMFSRFYFIVKCILNNSSYRDIFSSYFCNKFDTRANFRFSVKNLTANHQWLLIFCIIIPSILILTETLRIFERPYQDISLLNFDDFSNALWCLITTMSTIGYGDFVPRTNGGRVVGLLSTLWGGFSLSWVIIVFTAWLYLSPEEELALLKIIESRKKDHLSDDEDEWAMPMTSIVSVFQDKQIKENTHKKRILKTLHGNIFRIEEKLDKVLRQKNRMLTK